MRQHGSQALTGGAPTLVSLRGPPGPGGGTSAHPRCRRRGRMGPAISCCLRWNCWRGWRLWFSRPGFTSYATTGSWRPGPEPRPHRAGQAGCRGLGGGRRGERCLLRPSAALGDPAGAGVFLRPQRMHGLWRSPENHRRPDRSALDPDLKGAKIRGYLSEPDRGRRRWKDRDAQAAVYANRRRIRGTRGRALQRRRAELAERSFAHTYESGGLRRTPLRGHANIYKRLSLQGSAFNLGLAMRKRTGCGTPRGLRELGAVLGLFKTWLQVALGLSGRATASSSPGSGIDDSSSFAASPTQIDRTCSKTWQFQRPASQRGANLFQFTPEVYSIGTVVVRYAQFV